MNKKKVTFAIVLFIILGLFVFAFANPLNDNDQQLVQSGSGDNNGTPSNNSGSDIISDITNNNNNSVNGRKTRRNNTRNLHNTTTIIDNTVSLIGDISAALNELKNYRSDYVYTDDSKYNELIKEYVDKINNSNSIDDINKNLTDGKDAIDLLIKEDLDAYKKNAKDEIKDYSETLDIRQDLTETLNDYYDQIDEASTKKEIDKLVEVAKKALDEIKTKEISDAKAKAKKEIEEYKKEDEEFISEIEDEKNSIYDNIDEAETLYAIEQVVEDGKKAIDDIIENKKFTVTFVTFNNTETKVDVGYKKDAKAPKIDTNPEDSKIYYEFVKWDKDYKNIKSDLTVTAEYKVTKVIAIVFLLKDGLVIPEDPLFTYTVPSAYKRKMEIELKLTDTILNAIKNNKYSAVLASDDDIRSVDKDNKLPKVDKDNKYKTYEFYVMKFCDTTDARFHIDGIINYDKEREALDKAKKELEKLIKQAKEIKTTDKTTASINKLNEDIKKAETNVKGNDITSIKESINDLSNIELVDIKVTNLYVTNNKESYFDNDEFDLTVSYDDNNGVKGKLITDYKVSEKNNEAGTHKATVKYKNVSATFEYEVLATEIVSIKVVNNKYEYFRNESADITVTATYNNKTTRVLPSNEYTSTFDSSTTTYYYRSNYPRTAVVKTANGKSDIFTYSISTYTKDEYNRKLINDIDVSVHHPWFTNDYNIVFNDMSDKVKIISLSQNGKKFITLKPTSKKNKYDLSEGDYHIIRNNNTFFNGDYIEIIYEVHGMKYKAKYSEEIGKLYLKKIEQM